MRTNRVRIVDTSMMMSPNYQQWNILVFLVWMDESFRRLTMFEGNLLYFKYDSFIMLCIKVKKFSTNRNRANHCLYYTKSQSQIFIHTILHICSIRSVTHITVAMDNGLGVGKMIEVTYVNCQSP